MLTKESLNDALADAVMDRPREFFIDGRRFCLWSPSLGMTMMLSRHFEELGIDETVLRGNPSMEALRLASTETDKVCNILSILSFRTFRNLSNSTKISRRADFFKQHLDAKDLSQLLLLILSEPKVESFISLSGIEDERTTQSKIAQIKKDKSNTLSFGGLTIYGSLISPAMSSLHMSFHDVVWGISLVNLRMLLADAMSSVFLSDEEAKALGSGGDKKEIFGMSESDFEALRQMKWD
ncbi:MAG: hypothetical protein HDS07_00430 [Bacteroides sp.]|nr:hypothetical protein [Bacteroides sp.]